MIRYALLELLNRVRKEINFEKSIGFFVFIRDYDQCKIGARSYQNTRPFSSDVYQEAVTMSKKVVRNKNYRFKNRKDESKKEEKKKVKSVQEDVKKNVILMILFPNIYQNN